MHLHAKPPVFVPFEFRAEIEALSKAALMDMVWDYAAQIGGAPAAPDVIMEEFRKRRNIILVHRNQAKSS